MEALQNKHYTTDEDTKKELASIKSKFNNYATTYTSGKKKIENSIKEKASITESATE